MPLFCTFFHFVLYFLSCFLFLFFFLNRFIFRPKKMKQSIKCSSHKTHQHSAFQQRSPQEMNNQRIRVLSLSRMSPDLLLDLTIELCTSSMILDTTASFLRALLDSGKKKTAQETASRCIV